MSHLETGSIRNVIFITSDQHRPDFLSCAGGPVETPNLDALAAEGSRLGNVYCQAPVCVPSRISMTTGRYPMNTGYFTNRTPIDEDEPTFIRQVQQSGIHTAMVGNLHHHVHSRDADFSKHEESIHRLGFDYVHETSGKRGAGGICCECRFTGHLRKLGLLDEYRAWTGRWGENDRIREIMASPWQWDPGTTQDAYIADQAIDFLRAQPKARPFYLHLGFVGPHPPFDAPEIYRVGFRNPDPINPDANPEWWMAYLACIREVDSHIGRVIASLDELGIREETLVLYSSDHGEMAGEKGIWGKIHLYQPSVNVPFIASGPGIRPGQQSDALAELLDIGATVCDAFGVPTHHWDQGRSLMPLLRGERPDHRATAYAEMGSDKMLFDGRHKLIYGELIRDSRTSFQEPPFNGPAFGRPVNLPPDQLALFDLESDPGETTNLALDPRRRDLLHAMERKLLHRLIANTQCAPADPRSVL